MLRSDRTCLDAEKFKQESIFSISSSVRFSNGEVMSTSQGVNFVCFGILLDVRKSRTDSARPFSEISRMETDRGS